MAHDGGRSDRLQGVDGATLHAMLEGAIQQFHSQVFDLRAAFAALPRADGERDGGMLVAHLCDMALHQLQRTINLTMTAAEGGLMRLPLVLVTRVTDHGDVDVVGVDVWKPKVEPE